jgi:hypothetical protein
MSVCLDSMIDNMFLILQDSMIDNNLYTYIYIYTLLYTIMVKFIDHG